MEETRSVDSLPDFIDLESFFDITFTVSKAYIVTTLRNSLSRNVDYAALPPIPYSYSGSSPVEPVPSRLSGSQSVGRSSVKWSGSSQLFLSEWI